MVENEPHNGEPEMAGEALSAERTLVFRAEAWRDARQGLELSLRGARRTRHFRASLNAQVLLATLVLNSTIVTAQSVGAWYANSLSLLVDCSSMLVDVISYAAALWAECSPKAKERNELIVSALSMLALWGVTLPAVLGALAILAESDRRLQLKAQGITAFSSDDEGSVPNPHIILGFALAGMACDSVALTCFCRQQRAQVRRPRQRKPGARGGARCGTASNGASGECGAALVDGAIHLSDEDERRAGAGAAERSRAAGGESQHRRGGEDSDEEVEGGQGEESAGDVVNMRSAFAHVIADSCRSVSTAVAALLIIHLGLDARRTDAVCSLVVAALVISASLPVCKLWCTLARDDFCAPQRSARARGYSQQGAELRELPAAADSARLAPASERSTSSIVGEESGSPNTRVPAVWHPLPLQPPR